MTKRVVLTFVGLILVIAGIGAIKVLQIGKMIDAGAKFAPPPETVTSAEVLAESWESALTAVGSLEAVQGVTVAAEMSGKVVKIAFEAGTKVNRGDLLVQQDTSSEKARLPGAEAAVDLAENNLERSRELLAGRIISQAEHDAAVATYRQALAEAENIRTIIEKKTIRAPFSGSLGIRQVNLGQILMKRGEYTEAAEYLRQAVGMLPDDAWAHACLGKAWLRAGNREKGLEMLEKARDLAPDEPRVRDLVEEELNHAGQHE